MSASRRAAGAALFSLSVYIRLIACFCASVKVRAAVSAVVFSALGLVWASPVPTQAAQLRMERKKQIINLGLITLSLLFNFALAVVHHYKARRTSKRTK
jgi:hypothetical protein